MIAVALAVAVAVAPVPIPAPTLKPLQRLIQNSYSNIAWQRDLRIWSRIIVVGPDNLLSDYGPGWKMFLTFEARGIQMGPRNSSRAA